MYEMWTELNLSFLYSGGLKSTLVASETAVCQNTALIAFLSCDDSSTGSSWMKVMSGIIWILWLYFCEMTHGEVH